MTQIVVPFRGPDGKSRIESEALRSRLAVAMLADVLAACAAVGPTLLVTSDLAVATLAAELGVAGLADPGGGQGCAVAAALESIPPGPVLVVNADVPCVVPRDLRSLVGATEVGAIALVEAADGTTNALGLPDRSFFAQLYGAGSAARFRDGARASGVDFASLAIPNLVDDVDTLDDLHRIALRAGPNTQAALAEIDG